MNIPPSGHGFAVPAGPPGGWPDERRRPATAWSSMTGTWQQIPIVLASKHRNAGGYVVLLGSSAVIALLTVQASARVGVGLLVVVFGFVAVLLAVLGIAGFIRVTSPPRRASYDGQLVARWRVRDSAGESQWLWHLQIDDGKQARTYRTTTRAGHVERGDLVRVTWNPRSLRLVSLAAVESPGQDCWR